MSALDTVRKDLRDKAKQARGMVNFTRNSVETYEREAESLERLEAELGEVVTRADHDLALADLVAARTLRPKAEWHEDLGPVLWWTLPIDEPPYCGTPLDLGRTVQVEANGSVVGSINVGGWPGYHTHWTPLVTPTYRPESASS